MRSMLVLATLLLTACATPPTDTVAPTPPPRVGAWLGETPPGTDSVLFASGVVSTGLYERDTAWMPDGGELYWSVYAPGQRAGTVVAVRRLADGSWTAPFVPDVFQGHNSLEPFLTGDGGWLYFASDRPLPGETTRGDWNLWRAPRVEPGWGPPEPLPATVNSAGDEYYPSLSRDGRLVFTAEREDSLGGEDLYESRLGASGWSEPVNLGPAVNSPGPEFNSLIHPDGAWLLFGSMRDGDSGGGDLYIAFAAGAGGFGPARPLPPPLNSPALDFCPALSPDGSILFFTSTRSAFDATTAAGYADLRAGLTGPGNGQGDIYWVDAALLATLRPQ